MAWIEGFDALHWKTGDVFGNRIFWDIKGQNKAKKWTRKSPAEPFDKNWDILGFVAECRHNKWRLEGQNAKNFSKFLRVNQEKHNQTKHFTN